MTDEQLIAEYIEKHGVTKIPTGESSLPQLRWYGQTEHDGNLREVKPDGTFYTRAEALQMLARRRGAKFKAYALGRKLRKAERASK